MSFPPTILIITHVIPFPPSAGNEIRILNLANWLRRNGFKVILLLKVVELHPRVRKSLEERFDAVFLVRKNRLVRYFGCILAGRAIGKTFPVSAKEAMAPAALVRMTEKLCIRFQPFAVIAEYIFTAPCLEVTPPGTLKIIDTHDVFSRKQDQVLAYGIDDPFLCSQSEERDHLLKGDLAIAIQPHEAALLKDLVPEREVITVGIDFEVVPEIDNSQVTPGSVLVVGSDNPLNIHGFNEFITHAWPIIRAGCPGAVLRVAGKVGAHLQINDDSIQNTGWVADLNCEYDRAAVVINPTIAGTGLKIKTVEALCRAKPLVGTPNSIDGLLYEGEAPFVIARDWPNFARNVIQLLGDAADRQALQKRAWQYARANFLPEKVYGPLAEALENHRRSLHNQGLAS